MTEVRVHGAADNLAADPVELLCPVAESHDLSGTHKCEVQGVEEEDNILPWKAQKEKTRQFWSTHIRYNIKSSKW